MKKEKKQHRLLSISTWVLILAIWYLVTNLGVVKSTLMPTPQRVWNTFIVVLNQGYNGIPFMKHFGMSMGRLLFAVVLAIVTAIPLGLFSGYFSRVQAVLDSLVNFYRPIPPMAYYVLLMFWMGIYEESKVMLLFLAAFAPIYISCSAAVGRIHHEYIHSAESLGANKYQIFFNIVLPACAPEIVVGIRTAVGVAYTTLVSAEMIAATSGIGWMVMDAYTYMKTDVAFVVIIIMGITGILLDAVVRKTGDKLVFWTDK